MFKVLLATDGSACALHAAEYTARMLLQVPDVEVTVVYVEELKDMLLEATPLSAMASSDRLYAALAQIEQHLQRAKDSTLEATIQHLGALGKRVVPRSVEGKAEVVICDIAEKENFDLVVVGSCGKGAVRRALMGSVSYKVSHQANVPVLVVRGEGPVGQ